MSILEELKWRGLVADCTDAAELAKRLAAHKPHIDHFARHTEHACWSALRQSWNGRL